MTKAALLTAASLALMGGTVHAQSVVMYGKLDLSITKTTGQPLLEDHNHSSRIGFKGSEDLGGDMFAIFQFEHRFNADTGAVQTPVFWKAQSYVGLQSRWGAVKLGRTYNPVDDIAAQTDPFGQDGVGSMLLNELAVSRQNNAVRYDSPTFGGFSVRAIYSFKEAAAPAPAKSQDGVGVAASYINGPLSLQLGWNRNINTTGAVSVNTQFGAANLTNAHYWAGNAGYDFGVAKVNLLYEKVGSDQNSQRNMVAMISYKLGPGVVISDIGRLTTEIPGQSISEKKFSLGYNYYMSKRTILYADASTYSKSVLNSPRINAWEFGITHNF